MVKQILQFIQNHWMLCSASIVVLLLLIFEEIRGRITGLPKMSAQDVVLALNRENALVIDLRTKNAFANGHILGAINVVRTEIDQQLKKFENYTDRTLILVDDYDSDLSVVNAKLQKIGLTKIYALAGGLNSWKDAQLPLSKN
jgi:rhodanese-related sulfurtransferase